MRLGFYFAAVVAFNVACFLQGFGKIPFNVVTVIAALAFVSSGVFGALAFVGK